MCERPDWGPRRVFDPKIAARAEGSVLVERRSRTGQAPRGPKREGRRPHDRPTFRKDEPKVPCTYE